MKHTISVKKTMAEAIRSSNQKPQKITTKARRKKNRNRVKILKFAKDPGMHQKIK